MSDYFKHFREETVEAMTRAKEAREKADDLHAQRAEANSALRAASARHQELVDACRDADEAAANAQHAVELAIKNEAWNALN